jgi:hypothetical protein
MNTHPRENIFEKIFLYLIDRDTQVQQTARKTLLDLATREYDMIIDALIAHLKQSSAEQARLPLFQAQVNVLVEILSRDDRNGENPQKNTENFFELFQMILGQVTFVQAYLSF